MNVLIATGVYPPEGGGPATYSKALSDHLPSRGITPSVLPFRTVRKYPKIIRHIAYFFLCLRRGRKVDVIYAQDPLSVGLPAYLAAFILRKPFALKVVGDYAWEQASNRFGYTGRIESFQDESLPFIPNIMRTLERFVARRARVVVVPSKYLASIIKKWGIPKERIRVVYNGIHVQEVGLKQVIRGLLRFKGKLIVSPGRLVPWKGFGGLIKVHANLKKRHPDLTLLIVGAGPEQETLEMLAEKLNVSDSVIFSGNVENPVLLRYIRAADVCALNTRYEGFSHVLLEAAAIGTPIVTTNIGGNPELIEDGVSGYLATPDDRRVFEERLNALLVSPELRARISGNAKRKVERFSVPRMVDETADILKELTTANN